MRIKTEIYQYEILVNELNIIPLTNISKKDYTRYLQYAKSLENVDDNDENYHSNNYNMREKDTTITEMYRFTVNNTDLYLYKTTCKDGYYFE